MGENNIEILCLNIYGKYQKPKSMVTEMNKYIKVHTF